MAIPWPAELPQTPLIRGYAEKRRDNRLITTVQGGEPKIRRLYTAVPKEVTAMLVLSNTDWLILADFFEVDLEDGTQRFEWQLPTDQVVKEFRFRTPPTFVPLSCDLYEVTLELEVLPYAT